MCIGDSLQLLDSHEQLGIPNTVERVANVKIADPLRGNGIEKSALEIPNTVHGEADVEMLVTREENANNQSKYYQSNVWFMILLIMYLSHCGYRRFTSITREP